MDLVEWTLAPKKFTWIWPTHPVIHGGNTDPGSGPNTPRYYYYYFSFSKTLFLFSLLKSTDAIITQDKLLQIVIVQVLN